MPQSSQAPPGKLDQYVPPLLKSKWTLVAICALAVVLRMAEAIIFPGFEYPDEIFQVLEQAHRLAFGNGIIPWEFAVGIRSYLLPEFFAGIFLAAEKIWPGSYLLAARFVISVFSVVTVYCSWAILRRFATPRAALIGAFLSAVWFELVFFGPKAHFEVIGGHLLLLGTYLVFPYIEDIRTPRLLFGGFLLGLAFCIRIQAAPMVAVLGLAMLAINGWRRVAYTVLGALVGIALAGFVDYLTLAYPFASIIGYFKVNLVEHVSDKFGRAPWHFMLLNFARVWSGALVLFLWFGIEGLRKSRPMLLLVAMAAALILGHTAIAHKEYRFVYPALPFLLIPIAAGIDRVIGRLYPDNAKTLVFTLGGIAMLSIVVASGGNFRGHFFRRYGETKAYQIIRKDPNACGVATHLVIWGEAPGYTVLHRDIPIYNSYHDAEFEHVREGANYLLSRKPVEPGYTQIGEWLEDVDPLYLYHREGGCSDRFLNERLRVRTLEEEIRPN
ncbi:MAG: Alg9 family protein mannosyltransferase [Candidatus Solibacter sp.]|nr:Alg9 family protein mannosyltransferase [Candidatus Solibacter sp.]